MALRLCLKIDQIITKTCRRLITLGAQKLSAAANIEEELPVIISKEKEHGNVINLDRYSAASYRRSSCKENARLLAHTFENEREILNRNLHNQYLQPATMPTLTETQNSISSQLLNTFQDKEIQRAQVFCMNKSASQQILENKTKEFKGNPKKLPKLMSNPFPDPLKATFSPYTICDQEKAQQMLDEHKLTQLVFSSMKAKKFSTNTCEMKKRPDMSANFYGTLPLMQSDTNTMLNVSPKLAPGRLYSQNCKKENKKAACPKIKACQVKQCPRMKLKGCPPPKSPVICEPKRVNINCKKVEAPYPSYSESCYVEDDRKTSCDICPWSTKTNPHFKGEVKLPNEQQIKYHTAASVSTTACTKNLLDSLKDMSPKFHGNIVPVWMQSANISHLHGENENNVRKLDFNYLDQLPAGGTANASYLCDKEQITQRNNNNYSNSNVRNEDAEYNNTGYKFLAGKSKIGYCERNWENLTNFFLKNDKLKYNYREGADLADFGINKTHLCRLLCSKAMYSKDCTKPPITKDYPKNCDEPYQDNTKICPQGLTHKKTRCERLKKKKSKSQIK